MLKPKNFKQNEGSVITINWQVQLKRKGKSNHTKQIQH